VVPRLPYWLWFLLGCGIVAGTQAGYLSTRDWNPTALLQVGTESPAKAEIGRDFPSLHLEPTQGHDGKYFYLIARHPGFWRLDAEARDGIQDPAYRYGRPLYPLVAGLGGTLPPAGALADLILVQVLAGGWYLVGIVGIARRVGMPAWAVWIGAANPAVTSSAVLLTSDLLAAALILGGLGCWVRSRAVPAIVLFAAAVLTKEYYALTPLVLGLSVFVRERRFVGAVVAVVPLLPLAGWRLALWAVLGPGEGAGNFTWPGVGIVAASGGWGHLRPLGWLGVAVVLLAFAATLLRTADLPRWQCAAWGALGLCASSLVWADPTDALRVLAPLWWFVLWAWTAKTGSPPAVSIRTAP
jgi:hypothetical protein